MSRVPYSNTVGHLMYAMVCTRPDISHVVGVVSKYMEYTIKEHWNIVKWMLQYLRGTSDYYITFNNNSDYVCGFVGSNFAGDLYKISSSLGYLFTLAGGAISWMSKLQETLALSTIEVEYIVILHAWKEAISQKGLLREIGRLQNSVLVFCDN